MDTPRFKIVVWLVFALFLLAGVFLFEMPLVLVGVIGGSAVIAKIWEWTGKYESDGTSLIRHIAEIIQVVFFYFVFIFLFSVLYQIPYWVSFSGFTALIFIALGVGLLLFSFLSEELIGRFAMRLTAISLFMFAVPFVMWFLRLVR